MARFGRNMAYLDMVLVALLLVLLYVFVNRIGRMSNTPTPQVVDTLTPDDASDSKSGSLHAVNLLAEKEAKAKKPMEFPEIEVQMSEDQPREQKLTKDEPKKAEDPVAQDERLREEIDARLKKIGDMRSQPCVKTTYDTLVLASIIIDFFDYQLVDLKLTVGSILHFTPASLIKEIIIVDDGSTLEYLIKDAQVFVSGIPKAVLVRNEVRQGRLGARMRGAKEANGHNLIFLDTSVIVSKGWLEPLVDFIQEKKTVIAQPHFDKITDPVSYEYLPIHEHLVASFSWSMTVRMIEDSSHPAADSHEPLDDPMIHGAAFAITKEYFEEIGGFDTGLGDSGGEYVELALRTWFCGGSVKRVPCSRVAVLNVHDPVKINSYPNIYRITEVWLKSQHTLVKSYLDTNFQQTINEETRKSVASRVDHITSKKCPHDMNWFMENIAKDMFAPSSDAAHFGVLKVRTGLCIRVGHDSRLDLGSCKPSDHKLRPAQMTFELMNDGQLKVNGKCLQCMDNAYTQTQACLGKEEPRQYWDYKDGRIVNRWSKYCLMHVTDPDPKVKDQHRQIAMAQPCDMDTSQKKEFVSFQFIKS